MTRSENYLNWLQQFSLPGWKAVKQLLANQWIIVIGWLAGSTVALLAVLAIAGCLPDQDLATNPTITTESAPIRVRLMQENVRQMEGQLPTLVNEPRIILASRITAAKEEIRRLEQRIEQGRLPRPSLYSSLCSFLFFVGMTSSAVCIYFVLATLVILVLYLGAYLIVALASFAAIVGTVCWDEWQHRSAAGR